MVKSKSQSRSPDLSETSPPHDEPVRTTEPSKLDCEICGKTFKTHSELDRHMENVHGNPEKTHTKPHDA